MADEQMEQAQQDSQTRAQSNQEPKKVRTYTPRKPKVQPTPPVMVPEAPNPAVLKLQASILDLVEMRGQLQENVVSANSQLRNAQACAESARERLQGVEQEVQYRMGLIAQMQGRPAETFISGPSRPIFHGESPYSESMSFPAYGGTPGIGSIPPARPLTPGVQGDVRRETAEMERAAI